MLVLQILTKFYTQFMAYTILFVAIGYIIIMAMFLGWSNLPTLMLIGNVYFLSGYMIANAVVIGSVEEIFSLAETRKKG